MSLRIYTEVEIMIWVSHKQGTPLTVDLPPRFLGYGLYNRAGHITPWRGEAPPEAVAGSQFWSAHLISVSNLPTETRDRYYNCLITPPTITETLPSLTSAITDFSSVTISLADPSIRSFFAVDLSEVSVQNFINIYRIVCDNKYLIWRGYLDGVSIDATHSTTIQARPITKRLDRQATFGFDDEIPKWVDNGFKIPIVAARLIPYSVQVTDHSAVGCEPFSGSFYRSVSRPKYRGTFDSTGSYYLDSSDLMVVDYDYGRQAMGAGAISYYQSRINIDNFGLDTEFKSDITAAMSRILTNYSAHLEHRRPQYVSFQSSDIVPTLIGLSAGGKMTFNRGIFFSPSEDIDVSSRFDPTEANYKLSEMPETYVSPGQVDNEVAGAHFERFLIGSEWFEAEVGGETVHPLRCKSPMFADAIDSPYRQRFEAGYTGYDQTSAFPSLNLGDSYANWTVIPVASGSQVVHDHPSNDRFSRPSVSAATHPLDSFYRWTLQADKSGTIVPAYLRACIYTPHAIGLTYYLSRPDENALIDLGDPNVILGAFGFDNRPQLYGQLFIRTYPQLSVEVERSAHWNEVNQGYVYRKFFIDNRYAFVRWSTFTTIKGGSIGKRRHIKDAQEYLRLIRHSGFRETNNAHTRLGIYIRSSSKDKTWLSNGETAVPMARSKDMYSTLQRIDRHIKIDAGRLAIVKGGAYEVDQRHQSGSLANLRVMPALPSSSIVDHDYPMIQTARSPYGGGAYYISASYGLLDEVGYWDSSILNNSTAASGLETDRYFRGHYHHDQSGEGQGVPPATFIKAVIQSAGFQTDLGFTDQAYTELSDSNPMQLISDSDDSYRGLLGRVLPGLGKFIRFNPYTNKLDLIDWSRTAPLFPFDNAAARTPIAFFDEDCMIYRGLTHVAASRVTSFIYQNQDMLRGTNTLDNFGNDDFRQAKYASFHSTAFAQGRTVTVPTGTWWQTATDGIHFYDRLASTLAQRIDVVSFFVPMEVLLGLGSPDFVSVGKWVRIANSALVNGIADVLVMETSASESGVEFRAYRFADTMSAYAGSSATRNTTIKDPIDNKIPLPTIPGEDDLPEPSVVIVTDYDESGTTTNIGGFIVPRDRDDNPDLPVMTVRSVGEAIAAMTEMAMIFRPYRDIDISDVDGLGFFRGLSVATDSDLIFIGDLVDDIYVYNLEGIAQSTISLNPSVLMRGIAVTSDRIYIVGTDVYEYGLDGTEIEDSGFELPSANGSPTGITVYKGEIYIIDEDNNIYVYSPDGERQRTISLPRSSYEGMDIWDDKIYTVSSKINVFDLQGNAITNRTIEYIDKNQNPTSVSVVDDRIYILDGGDDEIYVYDRLGYLPQILSFGSEIIRTYETASFGTITGRNSSINGIAIANNQIYLYDNYDRGDSAYESVSDRTIYAFDLDGQAQSSSNISFSFNYDPVRRSSIFDPFDDMHIRSDYIYILAQSNNSGTQAGINRYTLSGGFFDRRVFPGSVRSDNSIYVVNTYRRMSLTDSRIYILSHTESATQILAYDYDLNRIESDDIALTIDRGDIGASVLDIDVHADKIYATVNKRTIGGSSNRGDYGIFAYNYEGQKIEENYIGTDQSDSHLIVIGNKAYVAAVDECTVYDISRMP